MNLRPELYKSPALPLSYGGNKNIPCSSAGEAQEGSHLSLTWVGFPILFSLGDVSQDAFQSLTPKAGFEPATSRLTVGGSATELLGIVLFFLEFEV